MALNSTKRGIIITCPGSIMVMIISTNQNCRPRKRMRAKPKATTAEEITMPTEDTTATKMELRKKLPKV